MSQKIFRHTPHRGADAIKILAGTKTNATIRDLEETIEDIEEKEGVVTVIDKDKINGNGWTVKDEEGSVYMCNCASNMYELPETEEYGGLYYPTDTVSVKFTVNPVLGTNTITEITSLGKNEEKIDLSKWKHGDKATKIIASPKSAISISDAIISFNYDNNNKVTADENEVGIDGKKTNITTNSLAINSNNITIRDTSLEDYMQQLAKEAINQANQQRGNGVDIWQQNNMGQINLNVRSVYIPANKQRIIKDLKDPSLYPEQTQRQPLLTGNNIDEIYIYPNGLVAVKSRDIPNKKDIFSTHNWIASPYSHKNLLIVTVVKTCECCPEDISGTQTYFNYCPHCKTWNTLYNNNNVISCNACHNTWCQACGHITGQVCTNKTNNLKKYNEFVISAIGMPCNYCKNEIPYGKTRQYANYCPKCHQWNYLRLENEYENGEERRYLHCDYCGESYCANCSISQGRSFINNFLNDNTIYDYNTFIENFRKIKHIRDE